MNRVKVIVAALGVVAMLSSCGRGQTTLEQRLETVEAQARHIKSLKRSAHTRAEIAKVDSVIAANRVVITNLKAK